MLETILEHLPYISIAAVLLVSGLGMPLPEDIPLLAAGALCAHGKASIWIMVPLCFVAVFAADCMLYGMGHRYGLRVTKFPILKRFLTPQRLDRAAKALHDHGGKTLFTARFLPGLRTPIFFTAGAFRIPFWKLVVFDGGAAVVSVPALVLAAYFFADQIQHIEALSQTVQYLILAAIIAVVAGIALWKRRRRARLDQLRAVRAERKAVREQAA